MAFDQGTRNRLARFVNYARILLTEEFTRQLQNDYGLDPESGAVTELEKLTALDDTRRETARILRETLDYYLAGKTSDAKNRREVLQRIVREQAFTILNRLCALRMAESRGILIESIAQGYQSKGFQLYDRLAGTGLGEKGDAYRSYLFSMFDEFAVDLRVLFDRFSPQGRLFPRQAALIKMLELINDPEIDQLWAEDETIGWIYQYFNTKEERKAMRDESQAPRNSRELAVRNQFFTPRYVVEFLTDNTLGRIWYEMTQGDTGLKDSCRYLVRRPTEIFLKEGEEAPKQENADEGFSQEDLLKQPVYIPYRTQKDPRELKMLDPACGSMHFGLYAFDLFEQIYTEAWNLEERLGKDALWRLADLNSLHETYLNKETFLRDMPRLIIERNIHGIDIDPRAVQISGLSLWLRAQRSWQTQGTKPQDRPQIRHSNIVCAEPMPGDRALLEEFLGTLKEDRLEALIRRVLNVPTDQKVHATNAMAEALAHLVRSVWQEMELVGEAGSLLKIEETLLGAIATARKTAEEKAPLFRVLEYGLSESPKEQYVQALAGDEQDFWNQAEALVLAALETYAEQAANGGGFQRRLFAGDAAQGFAFIELCRKRYDIAVMNPPFGEPCLTIREHLGRTYPLGKHDIFAQFIERMIELTHQGYIGTITSRTCFFLSSFQDWRKNILLSRAKLTITADLGNNVLDAAMVETAAYILDPSAKNRKVSSIFVRLNEQDNRKNEKLLESIAGLDVNLSPLINIVRLSEFSSIPGSPIAYWITHRIRSLFKIRSPFAADGRHACVTNPAGNDTRYFRLFWEVDPQNIGRLMRWVPLAKGGEYSPFYSDIHLLIDWDPSRNTYRGFVGTFHRPLETPASVNYFFRPGVTWPRSTVKGFSVRSLPEGSIFSDKGPCAFVGDNKHNSLLGLLAVMNSHCFEFLTFIQHGSRAWEVGFVKQTPFPNLDEFDRENLAVSAKKCIKCKQVLDVGIETTRIFVMPSYIQGSNSSIIDMVRNFRNYIDKCKAEDLTAKAIIEQTVFKGYGLLESDQKIIDLHFSNKNGEDDVSDDDFRKSHNVLPERDGTTSILSYLLGLVFGRWDIRYAKGEKTTPDFPDPFASLPACSPGMLQNMQGLPATPQDVPSDYPLHITWGGILVDNEGHPEDIEGRVRQAMCVIWDERAEGLEAEACHALETRSLREFFQKPALFFDDHLKRYSKSRRQAPIYWPLSTPSNSYNLWLYYHRLSDQTLFTCINDFVDPKLEQVSEEASRLRMKKGRSASDEKELERLTDFERELKDFRDELLRVAKFWKPDLNDGVQITAAPLWKLFQYKPWQKKLKETWESLEAGEYDWAHLAYSIWPERVREKCKIDKSLAIAHDLEHLYVEPKAPMKKKAGRTNQTLDASLFETMDNE